MISIVYMFNGRQDKQRRLIFSVGSIDKRSVTDKIVIEMGLDKIMLDTGPFVNEKLFCVSEDLVVHPARDRSLILFSPYHCVVKISDHFDHKIPDRNGR